LVVEKNKFGKELTELFALGLKLLLSLLGQKDLQRERSPQNLVPHQIVKKSLVKLFLGFERLDTTFGTLECY
jgi:hypothetical protein